MVESFLALYIGCRLYTNVFVYVFVPWFPSVKKSKQRPNGTFYPLSKNSHYEKAGGKGYGEASTLNILHSTPRNRINNFYTLLHTT